jgi:hypothetical protein
MTETSYNRRPVEILEIKQPRCGLRFGVGLCTASGTPKCYNTRTTCQDTANFDSTGASIAWRFVAPENEADFAGIGTEVGNVIETPAIPCLVSTSTQPTRLNVGASRDGESPFGVRSSLRAGFQDIPWADHFGDYYRDDRTDPTQGTIFAKFKARNEFFSGFEARLFEGYAGQDMADMQQRLFLPQRMDGPNASGAVSLNAVDPLQLADRRRSLFPRPTPVVLKTDIDTTTTTISVYSSAADLTDSFGNTAEKYIRSSDEIMSYTGSTLVDAVSGEYTLDGIIRATLGTIAESHDASDTLQRVGHYVDLTFWNVLYDLLTNHTPVGLSSSYIDLAQWNTEGNLFLGIFLATGTVPEPTPVTDLAGELSQQGLFSVWWDERRQTIPLLAVRPPQDEPIKITDSANILRGAELRDDPEGRLTRVLLYYRRRNPTTDLEDPGNYSRGEYVAEPDLETVDTGGEIRTKTIYSRWIREDALAIQLTRRLLLRFTQTPRYLTVTLDAKDRSIKVGDVLEVTTRTITNSEGTVIPVLWQVISENEIVPGETVIYDCQTYGFIGRFAKYMADGSPDYLAATDAQRSNGAFYANASGTMSNGDDGYQYQ